MASSTGNNQDDDIAQLKAQLKQAQSALQPKSKERSSSAASYSGMGAGLSIAIEMLVALLVGLAIGYYLDLWLDTKPWLLILFCFFGMGAALSNAIRKGKELDEKMQRQRKQREQS